MKAKPRISILLSLFCVFLLQWPSLSHGAPIPLVSPKPIIEKTVQELLTDYQNNEKTYQKNPEAFVKVVREKLEPMVAIDELSRYVMGRFAHRAQPEQITQFTKVFEESLIAYYSKSFSKLSDSGISIKEVADIPKQALNDYQRKPSGSIIVKMDVKSGSETHNITFSMVHREGRWKIRNYSLNGLSMGKVFQGVFSDAMKQHGKIQYVVDNWLDIMKKQ